MNLTLLILISIDCALSCFKEACGANLFFLLVHGYTSFISCFSASLKLALFRTVSRSP